MKFKGMAAIAFSTVTLLILAAGAAHAQPTHKPFQVIQVEVSQDFTRFSFDEAPVSGGLPAFGNPFVVQGYIYPAGTIVGSLNNGTNPDGSPEFPNRVIGEWTCWGHFIGNGAETAAGEWVVSTQIFSFGEDSGYGAQTIVTAGYETVDGIVQRAVSGGTGDFLTAGGVQRQQVRGHNASGALTLSEELEVYVITK